MAEHADGIGVPAHHHVRETDIVVCREVSSHDAGEHGLLVKLNIIERLEGKAEIAQQTVHSQQPDDGKVSQHLVQVLGTIFTCHGQGLLISLHGCQLLGNLRSLDKRVENIENAVASPSVGVLAQDLNLLLVVGLSGDAQSVRAERVELVNELIDDIPGPVVLK